MNVCEEHKNEREARGPERTQREARRSNRTAQTCELRATRAMRMCPPSRQIFLNYDILYFDNSTDCNEMSPFSRARQILFEIKIINWGHNQNVAVHVKCHSAYFFCHKFFYQTLVFFIIEENRIFWMYESMGLTYTIFTSYFLHILEIKITDQDSNQNRNVWLKLLFFFIYGPESQLSNITNIL